MSTLDLDQIEADVIIVVSHETEQIGQVIPFWECTDSIQTLTTLAAKLALQFAEDCGGGSVTWQVIDFRKETKETN